MNIHCPEAAKLDQFLQGAVSGPVADAIEQHLSQCPECARRAAESESHDTLVDDLLRGVKTMTDVDTPLVDEIVARLRGLPVWLATPTAKTVTEPITKTGIPPSIQSWLDRPREPGEIGRLGKYRVVGLLGSGAMGVVLDAIDMDLQRPVALKVMLPEKLAVSETARSRFRHEAILAAAVRHENIVTIHDVGEIGEAAFLAFERLSGETLQDRLDRSGRIPLPTALKMIEQVLLGLHAAHQIGLIHRDIKPSNIWLVDGTGSDPSASTSGDSKIRVKILDFGLARAMDADSRLTLDGTLMGTPGYWSPEQASGRTVDTRSDLFSIGCVFYRMVTGRLPFSGSDLLEYFMALATRSADPPSGFDSSIPTEVDEFTARLLAKDLDDRFSSADECLRALRQMDESQSAASTAFATYQPIPTSRRRMSWLWLTILGLLPLVVVAAVIRIATNQGTIVITTSADDVVVEIGNDQGKPQIVVLDRPGDFEITLTPGDYELRARRENGLEFSSTTPIRVVRGEKEIVKAEYLLHNPPSESRRTVDATQDSHSSTRVEPLMLTETKAIGGQFARHWSSMLSLGFSSTEDRLLTGGADGTARLWDMKARSLICELDAHSSSVTAVAIHPQEDLLATADEDGLLKVWFPSGDSAGYRLHKSLVLSSRVHTVRFSHDGQTLAAMTRNSVRLYDTETFEPRAELPCPPSDCGLSAGLAFFHHSKRLAVRGEHHVSLIDTTTWENVATIDLGDHIPTAIFVSADDRWLASGLAAPRSGVAVADLAEGRIVRTFESTTAHDEPLCVQFSPDNRRLLAVFGTRPDAAEADPYGTNRIRQWQLDSGQELATIKPVVFNSGFLAASYYQAGGRIIAISRDAWGTEWDATTARRISSTEPAPFFSVAVAAESNLAAGGAADGRIHLLDLANLTERQIIAGHDNQIFDLEFRADGRRLVSSGTDDTVRMWDVESGRNEWTSKHWSAGVQWIDANTVMAGGRWYEHAVRLFAEENGRELPRPDSWSAAPVTCVAAAHPSLVATGYATGPVKLWDLVALRPIETLAAEPIAAFSGANALAFSPDAKLLAAAYDAAGEHRGRLVLWDVQTRRLRATQEVVTGRVMTLAFDPTGQSIAVGTWGDCSVRVWEVPTLRLIGSLRIGPYRAGALKVAYFDNGNQLAVLGSDGRIHIVMIHKPTPQSESTKPD